MPIIRWDTVTYAPLDRAVDGPWGRYLVHREKPRRYIVKLNGVITKLWAGSQLEAMQSVDRVIRADYPEYSEVIHI